MKLYASVAPALEKTEPWKNEEISLFKWIHSPLLTDFEDGLRRSKAVSEEESEGKHRKLLDSREKPFTLSSFRFV